MLRLGGHSQNTLGTTFFVSAGAVGRCVQITTCMYWQWFLWCISPQLLFLRCTYHHTHTHTHIYIGLPAAFLRFGVCHFFFLYVPAVFVWRVYVSLFTRTSSVCVADFGAGASLVTDTHGAVNTGFGVHLWLSPPVNSLCFYPLAAGWKRQAGVAFF